MAGWFGRFPAAVESREDTYPFWLSATQSKDPKHPLTWLARPAGFEPATRCLEGTFEPSRYVA